MTVAICKLHDPRRNERRPRRCLNRRMDRLVHLAITIGALKSRGAGRPHRPAHESRVGTAEEVPFLLWMCGCARASEARPPSPARTTVIV